MSVEHRAAPARDDIELDLATEGHGTFLRLRKPRPASRPNPTATPEPGS